jgi:hypothetical protein
MLIGKLKKIYAFDFRVRIENAQAFPFSELGTAGLEILTQ